MSDVVASSDIRVEVRDRVAVLTVQDPDRRNALTPVLSQKLADAVSWCEQQEAVAAVVVTGAGSAFCAGADLTALKEADEQGLRQLYAGFLAVAACQLPTIAAVNGAAVGAGLNLALACDVRVAGPNARFDTRFMQLGIHPGGGMTWLVQRIVGPQVANAMVLFGQVLDASQADRIGLVYQLVDEPVSAAVTLASSAASAPRDLVLATKSTLRDTANLDSHMDAVELELVKQLVSMETPEFQAKLAVMRARISRGGDKRH